MKTFIHAIRFLSRSKTYTLINLLGLAFSLACCIVLMRYIHREMTVDTHCIDREKVFAIKLNQDGTEFLGNLGMFVYDSVKIDRRHIETRIQYIPLPMDHLTAMAIASKRRPSLQTVPTSNFSIIRFCKGRWPWTSPRASC